MATATAALVSGVGRGRRIDPDGGDVYGRQTTDDEGDLDENDDNKLRFEMLEFLRAQLATLGRENELLRRGAAVRRTPQSPIMTSGTTTRTPRLRRHSSSCRSTGQLAAKMTMLTATRQRKRDDCH